MIHSAVSMLDKAYERLTSFPYVVFYTSQDAVANVIGMKTTQKIRAVSLFTPNGNMTDSSSHSLFLNTKDRFYDNLDGCIVAYQAVGKEGIEDAKQVQYNYQKFIHAFGKLPKKAYFVSNTYFSKESILHDNYLSENENEALKKKENGTHRIFGYLPYEIHEESVLSADIRNEEDMTVLDFELDIHAALDYYLVQMLSTGALYDYPKFTSSHVRFYLKDENLIKVEADDIYTAKTGFLSANLTMHSFYVFLYSKSDTFSYQGKEERAIIPSEKEESNLYRLFE